MSGSSSVVPSAVSEYSTRGGTTGYTTRSTNLSRFSWRTVKVSIRCEIPSIDIENLIDPRDTRPLLIEWVNDAYERLSLQVGKKQHHMRP